MTALVQRGAFATAEALGYLIATTARNRVRALVRRARNPRQAIALLLGIGYFWFYLHYFIGARSAAAGAAGFVTALGQVLAILVVFGMAVWWWVFGGDATALAFTPAEVSFLFTAPVSRRALVGYKLAGTQLRILVNVVVWVVILRRGSPLLPVPLRAIGIWIFFTSLSLHRLGSAIVRSSWAEHGLHGVRRHRVALGMALLVAICAAISVARAAHLFTTFDGEEEFIERVNTALTVWPAGIVLWPVRAAVSPMLARSAAQWLHLMPAALLVLVAHLVWVVRSDTAFEEAAVAATAARAKWIERMRTRRSGGFTAKKLTAKRGLPLSPVGPPTVAIIWKNFICLRRRAELQAFLLLLTLIAVVGFSVGTADNGVADGAITAAVLTAVSLAVLGPLMLRVDLRQDMLNIVALKSLPMSGRTIVTAEVLSAIVPIAVAQLLLVAIAAVLAVVVPNAEMGPARVLAIVAGGLPALVAFDGALITIQNGAPVLFPQWTRLGAVVGGGIEVLGQGMLVLGIIFVILALMLLVPTALAAGILWLGKTRLTLLIAPALIVAAVVLAAEVYGALGALGAALQNTEPSEVA